MSATQTLERCNTWELPAKRLPRRHKVDAQKSCGYELRVGAEDFLRNHPDLRSFLDEVAEKLREIFGADSDLAVECFEDPESPSSEVRLFLLVKTPLDVATAQVRLDQFDESWWLNNATRANHLLQIALEFV